MQDNIITQIKKEYKQVAKSPFEMTADELCLLVKNGFSVDWQLLDERTATMVAFKWLVVSAIDYVKTPSDLNKLNKLCANIAKKLVA